MMLIIRIILCGFYAFVTAKCPHERDNVPGSVQMWPNADIGAIVVLPCPPGSSGNITRQCKNGTTEGGPLTEGTWEKPDISQCRSISFLDITRKADEALDYRNPEVDVIIDVMDEMKTFTTDSALNSSLYPQDLFEGSRIMNRIAGLTSGFNDIIYKVDKFSQEFGDTISTLVAPYTLDTWNSYNDKTEVSCRGLEILTTMEVLAHNLINVKLETIIANPGGVGGWNTMAIESEFLDFYVKSFDHEAAPTNPIFTSANDTVVATFPESLFQVANEHKNNPFLYGVYSAQFSTINQLLESEGISNPMDKNDLDVAIASSILSSRFIRVTEDIFKNLSEPIVITFRHLDSITYNGSAVCAFINESASSSVTRWSDEGCYLFNQNETHSTCHCFHLTNFALLMNIFKIKLPDIHEKALTFISYIGGSLSIIGCFTTIIVYEMLRLRGERVRIHEMLGVSIILVQGTFFLGFERTNYNVLCKISAILLHYFLTAMFCWMLVEGIHLYTAVVKVFQTKPCFKRYFILGWGLPVLNMSWTLVAFFDHYGTESYCWLSPQLLLYGFVPFVGIVIMVNTVVLVMVLRVMVHSLYSPTVSKTRKEDLPMARTTLKATVTLLPLLGLTWIFGFLSIGTGATLFFTYLFTITNTMQGIVFFVFHCALNIDVQQAFIQKWKNRDSTTVPQSGSSDSSDKVATATYRQTELDMDHRYTTSETIRAHEARMRICVTKRSSAASTESVDTNQTLVDESELNENGQEKSESEISEKALKEKENQQSKRRCVGTGNNSSDAVQNLGSKSPKVADNALLSSTNSIVEENEPSDIQEALDMLESAIHNEGFYVNYI